MAFQYQKCSTEEEGEQKWYGWMVVGSQSIGTGAWGDEMPQSIQYYLFHLGIALFPYTKPDDDAVRAFDLSAICPLSLDAIVPYGHSERPHFPVQHFQPDQSQLHKQARECDQRVEMDQRSAAVSNLTFAPHTAGLHIDRTDPDWRSRLPFDATGMDDDEILNAYHQFFSGGVEQVAKQFPIPTKEELEAVTMNPVRIKSDLEWLESHVTSVCGGQLPPLCGPYAIPFLLAQLEGARKNLLPDGCNAADS